MYTRCCWANGSCDDRMLHCVVIFYRPSDPSSDPFICPSSLYTKQIAVEETVRNKQRRQFHTWYFLFLPSDSQFFLLTSQQQRKQNKQTNKMVAFSSGPFV